MATGDIEMVSNPAKGISAEQEIAKLRHQLRAQERQIEKQQKYSIDEGSRLKSIRDNLKSNSSLLKISSDRY